MIKRMKYKPFPEVPPPKYAWYWEPFEWEEEEMPSLIDVKGSDVRTVIIEEPKCPYCGKQMDFVSKHQDCDPLRPQFVIGFRCNTKKCGFYVQTTCEVDKQKDAVDFLLHVIEEEKE